MRYNVLNDLQLSKNFKLSEFECHDGKHEVLLDMKLVTCLQALRDMLGVSIYIAAGYRNEEHNTEVGGSPNSRHKKGQAADIKVGNIHPLDVAIAAEKCGFKGIGVYSHNGQRFTHVDVRETKSYWHDQRNTETLKAVTKLQDIPR